MAAAVAGIDVSRKTLNIHISGGRWRPRDAFHMAATTACMHNPEMAELCGRLRERCKCHKAAVTAVMRKLTVTANALLRDRRMWVDRAARSAG